MLLQLAVGLALGALLVIYARSGRGLLYVCTSFDLVVAGYIVRAVW